MTTSNPYRHESSQAQADSDLPAMTEDDSFLLSTPSKATASNLFSDGSHMDERAMRRHLHDIESSFLPDMSPYSPGKSNQDINIGTSSFNARMSANPHNILASSTTKPHALQHSSSQQLQTAFDPPTARAKGFRRDEDDQIDYNDSSFSTQPTPDRNRDHSLSSPIADATKRSQMRSKASSSQIPLADLDESSTNRMMKFDDSTHSHEQKPKHEIKTTASHTFAGLVSPAHASTPDETATHDKSVPQMPEQSQSSAIPTASINDSQAGWSKTHQTTQRFSQESGSSFNTNGIDYALGSGGATPATLRASRELSRIPSLGSVASSIGTTDSIARRQKAQAQAAQALTGETPLDSLSEEKESPVTPRATRGHNPDPTNTVLNQHVRNIEVPDTVARDYRATLDQSNRPLMSTTTPFFGRGKNDLTLKEQNSRIDKLSKENFDLKLKIHYLYQALQDRSDEGVKDLVSKNAQLQADLLKSRKEIQSLKKRLRDHDRPNSSRQGTRLDESEDELSSKDFRQGQLEEEILWLRERMQYLEKENDKLNQEGVSREFEKRRLADQIKSLGAGGASRSDEVWKDMVDAESARRQQAELQARGLQQEIARLRNSRSPVTRSLRRQASQNDLLSIRSRSNTTNGTDDQVSLTGTTAVEQLRQENADLRRDLGAQTSMLTSRNRERERLQEEIESLKLMHRRGEGPKSIAGDSILDRSVSRQHLRPTSRGGMSQQSGMSDSEREQYETAEAALRDENMILRMRVQDMQRDLDFVMEGAEHIDTLRAERDEALRSGDEDRDWAATTIDEMEIAIEEKEALIVRLQEQLESKAEESDALQQEIKSISESLNRVADDCDASQSTIQDLQQSLANATGEIESLEQGIKEATEAKERLEVQAESSQGEISFLREEQESDKIKLSDLEAALRAAKNSARNEQERMRELAALEADLTTTREDARRLRKELSNTADEYAASKESMDTFERRLREAIGNFDGNRASLLSNIIRLQQDLERADESSKDHARKHQEHEKQLQMQSQEARHLVELLEREKQGRKDDVRMHAKAQWASRNGGEPGSEPAVSQQARKWLVERNELLLTLWKRLAALCGTAWAERHNVRQPTLEDIANSLVAVEQPLELAIQAIEKTLTSFRSSVHKTERDIHRDFSALEAALNSRARRLDALEKTMARSGPLGSTISSAEFQRLKDENRSMNKEIRRLRQQQGFALPGLPNSMATLPTAFDVEPSVSPQSMEMSASAAADAATAAAQTAIARDYERTSSFSSVQAGASGSGAGSQSRRRSQINSPLPTSPEAQRRSISALIPHAQHQRQASWSTEGQSQTNNASTTTTATTTQNAEGRMAGGRDAEAADMQWLLRLQKMNESIEREREGRTLDRQGARERLAERAQENETLRRENQRLRAAATRQGQGQSQSQSGGGGGGS